MQYRSLLVVDEDPANDRAMLYNLRADVRAFEKATAYVRVGMQQKFIAEPSESGFLLQDTVTGLTYKHKLDLAKWDVPRELTFAHQGLVYWPTSRASQNQALVMAPELKSDVSVQAIPHLTVGGEGRMQYRWHRYAERAGYGGGMNTQYVFGTRGYVEFDGFPIPEKFGSVSVSADVSSNWQRRYSPRESLEAGSVQPTSWNWYQSYGWDASVGYTPKQLPVTLSMSVEHGGGVLKNGIVNTFFANRDETELVFSLSGKF
jgi:hypothetical protein